MPNASNNPITAARTVIARPAPAASVDLSGNGG